MGSCGEPRGAEEVWRSAAPARDDGLIPQHPNMVAHNHPELQFQDLTHCSDLPGHQAHTWYTRRQMVILINNFNQLFFFFKNSSLTPEACDLSTGEVRGARAKAISITTEALRLPWGT